MPEPETDTAPAVEGHSTARPKVEAEITLFFVNLAQSLGMPKSVGEIFGTLFCAPDPLCFDDVVERTGISKGSASQGLRTLQRLNAVRHVYVARDRRTFYAPELGMRKLVDGFLRETVKPHLRSGSEHLSNIGSLIENASENGEPLDDLRERLTSLETWNKKASRILPWLVRFTGRGD